jgi:hypothetical protein
MPMQQTHVRVIAKLMKIIVGHVLGPKKKEPSGTQNQMNGANRF